MPAPYRLGYVNHRMVVVPGSGINPALQPSVCDFSRVSTWAASVPVSRHVFSRLVVNPHNTGPLRSTRRPRQHNRQSSPTQSLHTNQSRTRLNSPRGPLNVSTTTGRRQQRQSTGRTADSVVVSSSTLRENDTSPQTAVSIPTGTTGHVPSASGASQPSTAATQQSVPVSVPHQNTHQQPFTGTGPQLAQEAGIGPPPLLGQGQNLPTQQHQQDLQRRGREMTTAGEVMRVVQQARELRQQNQVLQWRLSMFQQLFRDKQKLASVVRTLGIKVEGHSDSSDDLTHLLAA